MRKIQLTMLIAILLASSLVSQSFAKNELAIFDQLRVHQGQVKLNTRIQQYSDNALISESALHVYVGSKQRTLAVYQNAKEQGKKVLVRDNKFWLFLPGSKRPLRITPMQRLSGDASVGDITTLNWQQDYNIIERQTVGDKKKLTLAAKHKTLNYQRIELWLKATDNLPVYADLYLLSGKLAKRAEFALEIDANGQTRMQAMTLLNQLHKDKKTIIHYDDVSEWIIPTKWFSPDYIANARF